jgi:serine/threonine-protein kinase
VSERVNGDLSGRTLDGRYEVHGELGRGGMARVYRATDTVLGRPVAVKVLSTQYADDANFVTRFRREAQAAARLNHPNLVQVYDTGSDDGVHYIVMEYVDAKTVADLLSGGRIMPDRAVELAEVVCDALTVAHAHGVIHRDVKPANIMVTRNGQVKVTDFGIARMTSNETVAQTAAVLGTASYLSPEQAQGGPIDLRSDLYSLGCVLYEMLTGRPPFSADNPVAVASKHVLEQATPPSRLNPDVTPQLDAVVMRALSKNPDNRYQDAEEMRADLERAREGMPVAATPLLPDAPPTTRVIHSAQPQPTSVLPPGEAPAGPPPEPGRRPGWLIALIVFLVLAVLGALLWLFARNLVASNETQQVRVPNVIGFTEDAAKSTISDRGLNPVVETTPSDKPPGTVIEQKPVDGSLAERGSDVTITVARAPRQIDVPSVVGQTVDEATATLRDAALSLGEVSEEESTEPGGTVISQNPVAESQVDKGTRVDVVVAIAPASPPPADILITDHTCQSLPAARNELERAGFDVVIAETPQFNPSCPQPNKVASQDPLSGSFPPGTTVTLVPTTKE